MAIGRVWGLTKEKCVHRHGPTVPVVQHQLDGIYRRHPDRYQVRVGPRTVSGNTITLTTPPGTAINVGSLPERERPTQK
jgi:hypothetical protein